MLSERKARILNVLIPLHIAGAAPVGSKTLAQHLNLSPATLRSELAALGEMGYLAQPHHSSGRVPTEQAYRWFAEQFLPPGPLDQAAAARIRRALEGARFQPERLLRQASQLSAELSGYVALTGVPPLEEAKVRQVHLSALGGRTVLFIFVLDGGAVERRVVEFSHRLEGDQLERLAMFLNSRLGVKASDLSARLLDLIYTDAVQNVPVLLEGCRLLLEEVGSFQGRTVFTEGTRGLLSQPELAEPKAVQNLISLLEKPAELLPTRLDPGEIQLSVGRPEGFSSVSASFLFGSSRGELVILGPVRMRYDQAIPLAKQVSDTLGELAS